MSIQAIIGLGNPGARFVNHRHNIGFMVVDYLADQAQAAWQERENLVYCEITLEDKKIIVVKPQGFMNSSGVVIPWLAKKGIKPADILVIHDELEFPFGKVAYRCGGSARGHNGLRSLIASAGPDFCRIRCGIGRPENKEEVANYVLSNFTEDPLAVETMIKAAADLVHELIRTP